VVNHDFETHSPSSKFLNNKTNCFDIILCNCKNCDDAIVALTIKGDTVRIRMLKEAYVTFFSFFPKKSKLNYPHVTFEIKEESRRISDRRSKTNKKHSKHR
jgi:hypothetical protein